MTLIGIIGAGTCTKEVYDQARIIGEGIARMGAVVICGGLGGVMEGACRGAYEAGGTTVGVLPGPQKSAANRYVTIPVVTDMGHARNIIIARSADILVAVSGGYGTLSEISVGLKLEKPVIGLGTWADMNDIQYVDSPEKALEAVRALVGK